MLMYTHGIAAIVVVDGPAGVVADSETDVNVKYNAVVVLVVVNVGNVFVVVEWC